MEKESKKLDMEELANIQVDRNQSPIRLDLFLMNKLERVTRSRIQKAIKDESILINDKAVKSNYKVRPNDQIQVFIPKSPYNSDSVAPEDIPLDIRYEDDYLLVVHKPAGMVVHPGLGNWTGTLVNAVSHHLLGQDIPVMAGNQGDRPGLVHRIDKNTTGLLVLAKTPEAIEGLGKQFIAHTIERKYYALVWGEPDPYEGTITGYIARHEKHRKNMHLYSEEGEGKYSVTHYKVIEPLYYVSLVECWLETGRTHQIRVSFQSVGNPLFNDDKYGGDRIMKGTVFSKYKQFVENCFKILPRQGLHASSLGFIHPITGEKMLFESELPSDMTEALEKWRKYVHTKKEKINA